MKATILGSAIMLGAMALAACESGRQAMTATADAAGAVAKRQDLMKMNGTHLTAIGNFLEKNQGTAADVIAHAEALEAAGEQIPSHFPAGSSAADLPGDSYAKPEIWANWPDFERAAYNLHERGEQLAAVASNGDKTAIAASFGDFGKEVCGGCHRQFRIPKE